MAAVVGMLAALVGLTFMGLAAFVLTGQPEPLLAMLFIWAGMAPAGLAFWLYGRRQQIRRGRGL